MSNYVYFGNRMTYPEYLQAKEFVKDVTSATRDAGHSISMNISRQTREVIASNEVLARENIRVMENLTSSIETGFDNLSYELQEISSGISGLNATFHWGFSQMLASMGRMNDTLAELVKIAKTPAQTAAYEQYDIARDAFRQGLYAECLESLDRAIGGDQATSGYKLEWRFHQMKGSIRLGFVNGDMSLVDLAAAEEAFALTARYASTDYPDHAAQAFLSAGWAAYCQGKIKEGLVYTENALAINPNLGEALFQAAKVSMALGDVDSALPLLGRAIDQDRFFALKAAGDGDFQRHDEKLRGFLEAMRKEKYRQSTPKVREALESIQKISAFTTEGATNKSIRQLEDFLRDGASWPIMDILNCVQRLNEIIAEARRLPIVVKAGMPGTFEESWQEQETYQEEVVIKPGGFFSKAVTELQTKTRLVTKKKIVTRNMASIEFCAIPAGIFIMGGNDPSSRPVHQVTVSNDFLLGKYLVTQAQWESIMGDNPSHFKGADRPVDSLSWEDCQRFIAKLNGMVKEFTFRLPTDAEWEYACRAGSTGQYCFGDDEKQKQLGEYAWYSANSDNQTQPVGMKKPNGWGLYDMHGNIYEWCQDWFDNYKDGGAVTNPQGPSSSADLGRVIRGGGFNSNEPHTLMSMYRTFADQNQRGFSFRLVAVIL